MHENPSPPPPPPAAKKGVPPLAWVGIGCGTILVIAIIVISLLVGWCKRTVGDLADFRKNPEKAAAELVVRMNPDLELVSQNEDKGQMTIRTKDGQEMTLSYQDIAKGRIVVRDAKGNVTEIGRADLAKVPAWVPRPPDLAQTASAFHSEQNDQLSGLYTAETTASPETVEQFFKDAASDLGFPDTRRTSFSADGVETRTLTYEGDKWKLNVILTMKPGGPTQLNVGYVETK